MNYHHQHLCVIWGQRQLCTRERILGFWVWSVWIAVWQSLPCQIPHHICSQLAKALDSSWQNDSCSPTYLPPCCFAHTRTTWWWMFGFWLICGVSSESQAYFWCSLFSENFEPTEVNQIVAGSSDDWLIFASMLCSQQKGTWLYQRRPGSWSVECHAFKVSLVTFRLLSFLTRCCQRRDGNQTQKQSLWGTGNNKIRAFSHLVKKSQGRKPTPWIPLLVGMGLNGGSLAWHIVFLLQQLRQQEALLLGCGLFQCMLEMFKPRGGRQLGHRPGGALPCQLLSPTQPDNPSSPFSWAQWLLPKGKSVRATLGWIFSQCLKTAISWTKNPLCWDWKNPAFFNRPKTLFLRNINIWITVQ